ncbi:hypothetical protein LguiA_004695 [Lonicera macranthoides]
MAWNHFLGHLPSSMRCWTPNLERIYLGNNDLSGSIPSSISNASKLTVIALSSNSFTGFIPNTLGNLRYLRRLLIGENNLTREVSTLELRFFNYLTNCKNLELLSISLNQFNGILLASIANLSTSLLVFEVFGSKIKGKIPIGIGNLSSLSSIVLDSNELERMGDLYLSHNKLNGTIPACLGELSSMRRLFLDSNNLTSIIPSTLWSLEDLLYLNFSTNSLTVSLPSDIGNLKVITQMDLSWNQFSGEIPSTIGSSRMLTFLSFAHNELQGFISSITW